MLHLPKLFNCFTLIIHTHIYRAAGRYLADRRHFQGVHFVRIPAWKGVDNLWYAVAQAIGRNTQLRHARTISRTASKARDEIPSRRGAPVDSRNTLDKKSLPVHDSTSSLSSAAGGGVRDTSSTIDGRTTGPTTRVSSTSTRNQRYMFNHRSSVIRELKHANVLLIVESCQIAIF